MSRSQAIDSNAQVRALARLYGPDAETQRRGLPEIADGLQAQMHELYARPNAVAAETLATNLDGARRAVLRYAEALRRDGKSEGQGDGR